MTDEHPIHAAAEIFPLMTGAPFEALLASIKEIGQQEPIWTVDGAVIDGRNRLRACEEAGVAPYFEERELTEGHGKTILDVVISLNLHRRHLTDSQRASVANKVAKLRRGANQHGEEDAQICASSTQAEAAEQLSVSKRSVQAARHVEEHGTDELQRAVDDGTASVSAAAAVADLSDREQRAAVAGGKRGVAEAAKKARAVKAEAAPPADEPRWELSEAIDEARDTVLGWVEAWPERERERLASELRRLATEIEAALVPAAVGGGR